jgi:copper chaperone
MCNSDSNLAGDLTITDRSASCACCAPGHAGTAEAPASADSISEDFLIAGMTCSHCVASLTEELSSLDGVEAVDVELNAGGTSKVTVASAGALDIQKVRDAVGEAGYDLVDAARCRPPMSNSTSAA